MEHTAMIAITHVDTALTRNLAFTQMGLAGLDAILVIWANCAKQVCFLMYRTRYRIAKANL